MSNSGTAVRLYGEGRATGPPENVSRAFKSGKSKVIDGPFTEAKEVVGGYWVIDVKSREEAFEWASRIPGQDNEMVEVRRRFDITDFPADVQEKLANFEQKTAEGGSYGVFL